VVFDWEIVNSENARTRGLSTAQLMACTKAFCRRVQRAGYAPMVYFNADWGYLNFDLSQITQYDFWLAQYKEQPDFYYNFKYWQYTSKGSVNGISGNVDLDVILLPR
jgi:Lyzozyme M1 (1,4-beta-N-acetylmuramidase)